MQTQCNMVTTCMFLLSLSHPTALSPMLRWLSAYLRGLVGGHVGQNKTTNMINQPLCNISMQKKDHPRYAKSRICLIGLFLFFPPGQVVVLIASFQRLQRVGGDLGSWVALMLPIKIPSIFHV